MPQAPNDEEEEKRLAGIAQDGDAIVLIDNITRPLGSGALDAILTSTRWKPRILGKTGNPEFEVKTTFLATSNNVQLVGDMPAAPFIFGSARPPITLRTDETSCIHLCFHG